MKLKIKIKIDMPLVLALHEFICSEHPTPEALMEIKYFSKKILKKINNKTESIDSEIPEFKTLSSIK